jgi:maleylacetoacetate isomerase
VSIADICLVAHLTSAKMLCRLDAEAYPTAGRIFTACMQLDAFASTHPLRQPDAPKAAG